MVESVLCYGSEVWTMTAETRRRINTVQMDYLRRSALVSKLDRITNDEIRRIMRAPEPVVDKIDRKALKWFGHLMRMGDERWPKRVFKWKSPGKNKRGRPRRSWNENIRRTMAERNLEEDQALDREAWRKGTGTRHLAVL